MKASEALSQGFGLLRRRPALALLPMLGDLTVLSLAYIGLAGPTGWKSVQLGQEATAATGQLRGFLPSAFPSVADLQLPMGPAFHSNLARASALGGLVGVLLLPLFQAFLMSLFFEGVAAELVGRPFDWRAVRRAWVSFAVLLLGARIGPLLFPSALVGIAVTLATALIWPLLPFAVGVLRMPLFPALQAAPGLLWHHFGVWFRLGVGTMLITFAATFVCQLFRQVPLLALLIYPWLSTALVGAAAALALAVSGEMEPKWTESPLRIWQGLATVLLIVAGAFAGVALINSWAGWYPTREAAVASEISSSGAPRPTLLKRLPEAGGELVVARTSPDQVMVARLRQGRFGWQVIAHGGGIWAAPHSGEPAMVKEVGLFDRTLPRAGRLPSVVVGEIYDSRVAYLQVGGERFPVGQDGPIILVDPRSETVGEITVLDAAGEPVPPREVKRP